MCVEYEGENLCVLDGLNTPYSNVDRGCCFRADIVHQVVLHVCVR